MRTEIDIIAQKAWAREEGRAEGAEDKAQSIARNLRDMGIPPEQIAKATGLSVEAIAAL